MTTSEVWEIVLWVMVGQAITAAMVAGIAYHSTTRGRFWYEQLEPAVPVCTVLAGCWFVGYLAWGPWWGAAFIPVAGTALAGCSILCAYVRDDLRRRASLRERGRRE